MRSLEQMRNVLSLNCYAAMTKNSLIYVISVDNVMKLSEIQWRWKQFASGGTMPALSAGRKFFDVKPLTFLLCPHMRGHNDCNDCLLPIERQLKW